MGWHRGAGDRTSRGGERGTPNGRAGEFAASPLDDASQDATFYLEPLGDPP